MNGNVTYHQQISYCGKPRCRKCRAGIGHGPYWYAYRTENGRTTRTYVGKNLPANVQVIPEAPQSQEPVHTSDDHDLAALRIRVLGQFSLERKQGQSWQTVEDSAWQHQRVRTLLACLLSSPGRRLGREQIMDALWPDADMETAANRLDRGVYSLRQLLEPTLSRPSSSQLLRIEREGLLLADQTHIWVDAEAFENLISQAHATHGTHEAETLLEEAAALYNGDFLPEERLAEWTMPRRETLQRSWMGLLLELADLRIASTAFAHAIEPLDRLLAADPTNEAAVQRLIISLAQLDRRGEALRAYQRFASALKREYNVVPLLETRNLYDAVQHGETAISIALPLQNPQRKHVATATDADTPAATRQSYKVQIGRSHQNPLIGRDSELATMQQVLIATEQETRASATGRKKDALLFQERQRRPQCILLLGEAGIGKTRLAEELSSEAQKRGWAVAWSRVYAQESGVPYRQWTEVLRNALTQGQWHEQEMSKHPLIFQPLSMLLPELHDMLPPVVFPTALTPEQEQLRLWEATLQLLTMMSERTPLLLVLDDFHWADASSSELFAYLVRRLHGRPVILVGTYRDNELPSTNPLRPLLTDLQREQAIVHLPIHPLTDEQISSLVSHVPHLPETLVQYIQDRAAGNPFFAEELARSLETTATATTNATELTDSTTTGYPLPDTIAAVLELRMSRLSSPCQRFLGNAAVLGGSFTFTIIGQLEASGPNGMSEDTLLDLIEEAIQTGVLTEEGTGTRITYHFWHPLLVSHLYDQLSAARRARLHRRAATVLQHVFAGREAENAATITNHLLKGGSEPLHIVHYAEMAADRAYTLSAYPEAEDYYRISVAQLDEQNGSPFPATPEEREHLSYLLERLGESLRVQGNSSEARSAYERVLAIRSHQHPSRADSDEQHEAQINAILWREIGLTWYDMGDTTQARKCCENGEKILREAKVAGGPAWAILRFQQSYIYWSEGNYSVAQQMAQEAQKLFENTLQYHDHTLAIDPHMTTTKRTLIGDPTNLGRIHVLIDMIANSIGQPTEALTHLNTALTLFEQAELQREIANTCCNIGDVYLRKAEHEAAQSFFRRSLYLAQRVGDIPLQSVVFCNMGVLASRSGDLKEAERLFQQSLILAERINEQVYVCLWSAVLTTALQDQGKLSEAKSSICHALKMSRTMNNAPCLGFTLIALGNLHIAQAKLVLAGQYNLSRYEDQNVLKKVPQNPKKTYLHFLMRAQKVLKYALVLKELESENRIEGQLALAQVLWCCDELKTAKQLALNTMEEAHQSELLWSYLRAQRLLGSILASQGEQEQAQGHFVEALQAFRTYGMGLEVARTLYSYGTALLQIKDIEQAHNHQQGLSYLREAQHIFSDCHATFDLHFVEHVLATYMRQNVQR